MSIRWFRTAAILVLAMLAGAVLPAATAHAQDTMPAFFRFLFGDRPLPPQPLPQQPGAFDPFRPGQPTRSRPAVEPKIVEQPKNSNAQVVLVLGDSQAAGLAAGLQAAFAEQPDVAIVGRTRPSLSLVRDDEFDFIAQLPGVLAEGPIDFVVIMTGVNDRQSFYDRKTGAKSDELRSDRWEGLYRNRVATLSRLLANTGKPVFWVGQPPTERPTHSAFMGYLNGLVRPIVEGANITFVDVWPGFTDDEGNFTYQGPDVDGNVKRLRASDGIHFTRAGQRKLAFFVEQGIRDLLRGASPTLEPAMPEAPTAQPAPQEMILAAPPPLPPAPWKKVGPVITMGGAPADGDMELIGAPTSALVRAGAASGPGTKADVLPGGYPITETPLHRRLVRGVGIETPAGRVDDFRWPRPR